MSNSKKGVLNYLSEFSIPLILGVIIALIFANVDHHAYEKLIETPLVSPDIFQIFGHKVNFHFLINDIFMVFFFGIAAVEITQSVVLGGSLNPISRAINPLLGTLGGVLGPIAFFFFFGFLFNVDSTVYKGWGIPTATDIALAWLVARMVFGSKHPAVSFLLLLAVADDAIGLGIIAIAYPTQAVVLPWLGLTLVGMAFSFVLRKTGIKNFWPYLIFGGILSWLGLLLAHLHPALALVFIVPFMPTDQTHGKHGPLFTDDEHDHSTLVGFEHFFKFPVDFGLLGFGLANAGVLAGGIGSVTWVVFLALLVGKTVGIYLFSFIGTKIGFALPEGMNKKELGLAGVVAGLGLTVALFVAGQAYKGSGEEALMGAAKMGALFSGFIALIAIIFGKVIGIKKRN